MQVDDRVSDDAGCFLLITTGCHHEYGDATSPRSPEHNLISFYNALAEEDKRKTTMSVYPQPQINKQFISVLALSLRKEERVFPYFTISLWSSSNTPVVTHMKVKDTHIHDCLETDVGNSMCRQSH